MKRSTKKSASKHDWLETAEKITMFVFKACAAIVTFAIVLAAVVAVDYVLSDFFYSLNVWVAIPLAIAIMIVIVIALSTGLSILADTLWDYLDDWLFG